MKITMVKKVLSDGQDCKKCREVLSRLEQSGYIDWVDRIVEADESDPASEGTMLADFFQVNKAPFFIVEKQGQPPAVYTVYFKLVKEVLEDAAAS